MTRFKIKEEFFTSVTEVKPMKAELIGGGTISGTGYSSVDHPKFTELRNKLEKQKFIQTECTFWNGDKVLKAFFLNGMRFNKGDQFGCASYIGIKLLVSRQPKYK